MGRHLRNLLAGVLSPEDLCRIYGSYDIVGDIAIVRITESLRICGPQVADAIMGFHRNVKTVLAQTGGVNGDYRLRKLDYVAGERRTSTVHKESGCRFYVDVERCFFSPRLLHERGRVAGRVQDEETVVNMFAGVGCFSIIMARQVNVARVFSIDVNPVAFHYMEKNTRVNNVYGRVFPILGDAKDVIKERLCHSADRILMPLPEKAFEYLPYALLALKKGGGWIHYYDSEHARKGENAVEKVSLKVSKRLLDVGARFEVSFGRCVRTVGPRWYQVVLDIRVES